MDAQEKCMYVVVVVDFFKMTVVSSSRRNVECVI